MKRERGGGGFRMEVVLRGDGKRLIRAMGEMKSSIGILTEVGR